MPRPRRERCITFQPDVTYFKPRGVPLKELEEVQIDADELEALRLTNMELLDQIQASEKMNISQPTLQRMLVTARKKLTEALVEGKAIRLEEQ